MKNEDVLDESLFTDGKVFTKSNITWAAVFGGPIAVAYMFASNFGVFGPAQLAVRSWLVAFAIYLSILVISSYLPLDSLPNFVYTVAYALIANGFFMKFQAEQVDRHLSHNGQKQGGVKAFLVIIMGMFTTLALIIGYMYLSDPEGVELLWQELSKQ